MASINLAFCARRKLRVWWRRHVYKSAAVSAVRDTLDGDDDDDGDKDDRRGSSSSSSSELADDPLANRWERDYGLGDVERLALLDEYLEMGETERERERERMGGKGGGSFPHKKKDQGEEKNPCLKVMG